MPLVNQHWASVEVIFSPAVVLIEYSGAHLYLNHDDEIHQLLVNSPHKGPVLCTWAESGVEQQSANLAVAYFDVTADGDRLNDPLWPNTNRN